VIAEGNKNLKTPLGFKPIRPSAFYELLLPEAVHEDYDGKVASIWTPGQPLVLQLSSYVRTEGPQVGAQTRLNDRLAKSQGKWNVWTHGIRLDRKVDQAVAETTDDRGTVRVHGYILWF